MKRTIALLLVTLLLLCTAPTFAADEGALRDGHYTAGGADLYLYTTGQGVMRLVNGESVKLDGVRWTEDSLKIEDKEILFTVTGDGLALSYEGHNYRLTYIGYGDMPQLGGAGYAGRYEGSDSMAFILAPNGRAAIEYEGNYLSSAWGMLEPLGLESSAYNAFLLVDSQLWDIFLTLGGFDLFPTGNNPRSYARTAVTDEEVTAIDSDRLALHMEAPGQGWQVTELDGAEEFGDVSIQLSNDDSIRFQIVGTKSAEELEPASLAYLNYLLLMHQYKADYAITEAEDVTVASPASLYPVSGSNGNVIRASAKWEEKTIHIDSVAWQTNGWVYFVQAITDSSWYWYARDTLDSLLLTFSPHVAER